MDSRKKNLMSGIGIVVLAAVMLELISVVQYQRIRTAMLKQMDTRSRAILRGMANDISHTLELTEVTMIENAWLIQRSLACPDSTFSALVYLIDDNPHVVSGCMAFLPDYYPSKGRLFEPYATKENGTIEVSQLAGPDHDYTQHEAFQRVVETGEPLWSDPYIYGPDSLELTTYSFPVQDSQGRLVAVCGLDMDLTWLGYTLNAHQRHTSSFGLLFTKEGNLVAYPSADQTPWEQVQQVQDILDGKVPESAHPEFGIKKRVMDKSPYWQVVQVYHTDEAFASMRQMRLQQGLLILLSMVILSFMIGRFARSEKKLRVASEEQARLGGELSVARNIQQEMLPKTFPPFVYGSLEPAKEVGGDLFDFFIRDGKLLFCIGDVSGKGVPAAMLMSKASSLFRLVARKTNSPSGILHTLNAELCRGNDSNMFLTFFMGCLDLYSGELTYGNAGHERPFVLFNGVEPLQSKVHLPLGVFPDTSYEDQHGTLAPGTTLVLYTDGVTEAKDSSRKQFGLSGIQSVLTESQAGGGDVTPRDLVSSVSQAAHRFAGEEPQSDDITVLVIRYAPEHLVREQVTLDNDIREIARLGSFIKDFCAGLDLEKTVTTRVHLAVEEAVVNVIKYAYPGGEKGQVRIMADSDHKELRFTIIDAGIPFDPTSVMEADTTLDAEKRPIGGLGVHLIRQLMDSVGYERAAGQNILTITKKLS